jgi:5-(carboxyamino)imidazole ribonucleotide mutase
MLKKKYFWFDLFQNYFSYMTHKAAIIMGSQADLPIMQEALKILNEYTIAYEIYAINKEKIREEMPSISKDAYAKGVRIVIAGTRDDANFSNTIAAYFNIPTVGIPCRSESSANSLESLFSILQQPNEHAVANVAFDSGQNAGILAVQILGLSDEMLQSKILTFKENLKHKILKANQELTQVKFEYKTN